MTSPNSPDEERDSGAVVLLSGPPGVGKSTVARLLTEAPGEPASAWLHADDYWAVLGHDAVPPYLPAARHQNEVVIGVLARAAAGYAAGGYLTVVDGVIGPWFVEPFLAETVRALGATPHYVVLRPDRETTLERGTTRPDHPLTDPGPIEAMYRQFADLGRYERHALDTTGQPPAATADAVRAALASGRCRLPGG
ncbi:AAA family ATPase [Streptomyces sp. NBRC 109706]|uniref:AAA family ATPase n=1 Tax=Streptomyces sp. NBRC 109706 TaxID=1550035 RepID=UPI000780315A|nr:AAA family ATPase [Streptomyces sp. NBRC 109706]